MSPERPYVPAAVRTSIGSAKAPDFRVQPPFIHGADRAETNGLALESAPSASHVASGEDRHETLPGVGDFLAEALPDVGNYLADEELPPLEHFLDPVPAADDVASTEAEVDRDMVIYADEVVAAYAAPETSTPIADDTVWADTDWQQYDWRAAAALGETADPDASTAWSSTDWEGSAVRVREDREGAAQAIANALDQIAARIRHGDLPVLPTDLVTDPAAIAATLAALLGVRR